MKQSKYYLLAILFFSYGASASVTLGGTRIVYEESKKEANISVSNQDKNSPVLIQTWVESFSSDDKKEVPFIVTPPYSGWRQSKRTSLELFILEITCRSIKNQYIG